MSAKLAGVRWRRGHHGYSLSGLLGTNAVLGETPPLPLPRAPSPKSDSNGDLSPSAIPTARRGGGERERGCRPIRCCIVVSEMQASHDRTTTDAADAVAVHGGVALHSRDAPSARERSCWPSCPETLCSLNLFYSRLAVLTTSQSMRSHNKQLFTMISLQKHECL